MLLFLLNVLWLVFGGFLAFFGWALAGVLMALTVVGLPWARSCFAIARFSAWPFGYDMVDRKKVFGQADLGTGALGTLGNVIWFVLAGWWLAIGHITAAVGLAMTVIGLPFAWQHVKLAMASLLPVGKSVVAVDQIRLLPGLPQIQKG